jgi:hypothetical protein
VGGEGVWSALGYALARGQITAPSEVLFEIEKRAGDDLHKWLQPFADSLIAPEGAWSPHMETVRQHAPHWFRGGGRNEADPFVVAMALERKLPVVTYEGQAFGGDASRVATYKRSMPHVCALVDVPLALMVDVLDHLGVRLA